MRAVAVVNPNATTTTSRTRDVLLSALHNDLDIEIAETGHRGHAIELAQQVSADGVDLIVAVGGDGTVNEVVNGIMAATSDRSHDTRPALAIVPGGNANVLARNLGIPVNAVEATGLILDAAREGRRHAIGLGRLSGSSSSSSQVNELSGLTTGRYFTFAAGAGLDADVVRAVEDQRAAGRTSTVPLYVRTAVRRFFAQPKRRSSGQIMLTTADAEPAEGLRIVIITNCTPWTYLGAWPLRPTPRADFNAGLDVFGLTSLRLPSTLRHVGQMLTQRGPSGRKVVEHHDNASITFTSGEPFPVQVDGDYVGDYETVTATSAPNVIDIVY
jgi:diacylglycerol kinase family enzyme